MKIQIVGNLYVGERVLLIWIVMAPDSKPTLRIFILFFMFIFMKIKCFISWEGKK